MTRSRDAIVAANFLLMLFHWQIDIPIDKIFFDFGLPILHDGVARVTHPWGSESPFEQWVILIVANILEHWENVRFLGWAIELGQGDIHHAVAGLAIQLLFDFWWPFVRAHVRVVYFLFFGQNHQW